MKLYKNQQISERSSLKYLSKLSFEIIFKSKITAIYTALIPALYTPEVIQNNSPFSPFRPIASIIPSKLNHILQVTLTTHARTRVHNKYKLDENCRIYGE